MRASTHWHWLSSSLDFLSEPGPAGRTECHNSRTCGPTTNAATAAVAVVGKARGIPERGSIGVIRTRQRLQQRSVASPDCFPPEDVRT
jgi:hypothetical protein